jgi:hypothetical protein
MSSRPAQHPPEAAAGAAPSPGVSFFHLLWAQPMVCVVSAGSTLLTGVSIALAHARGQACDILVRPSWALEAQGAAIANVDRFLRREHPNARLTVLAPTAEDVPRLGALDVAALWANCSAFIDERIYFPEPDAPKLFDAVHNAQTKPFKRHELAYGLKNLALITYAEFDAAERVEDLVRRYRDLSYVNFDARGGALRLDGAGVRGVVSRARCGLVLSEVEGPNNASMEYLLCGLPVVTTPSRGGREAMFDPRHVTIVEPRPEAVEAAVAAYQRGAPDPDDIRASALARSLQHRARLIAWLSEPVGEDLLARADKTLWLPQFRDKLRRAWKLVDAGPGAARAIQLGDSSYPTI